MGRGAHRVKVGGGGATRRVGGPDSRRGARPRQPGLTNGSIDQVLAWSLALRSEPAQQAALALPSLPPSDLPVEAVEAAAGDLGALRELVEASLLASTVGGDATRLRLPNPGTPVPRGARDSVAVAGRGGARHPMDAALGGQLLDGVSGLSLAAGRTCGARLPWNSSSWSSRPIRGAARGGWTAWSPVSDRCAGPVRPAHR